MVWQVNYLGIFDGTRKKKPVKTTLVSVALTLSTAHVKKTGEN
jgi:hypothetical protein